MLALLQRVNYATVTVANKIVGQIDRGILVFVGVEPNDTQIVANKMSHRIINYRLFADRDDRMNLSVQDINGAVMLVPQFTLAADTKKGMRPSFTTAAAPEHGKKIFTYMLLVIKEAAHTDINVQSGEFGANMQVTLCNDGPATFLLT